MVSKLVRISGISNILGAILLFLSFCSIGLFMWEELSSQNFTGLVVHPFWVPINIVFLISTILILFGLVGLYLKQAEKAGVWGMIGFFLCFIGVTWYACITYYETFFWPVIAAQAPTLFPVVGFSATDKLISFAFWLSGLFWGLGYIIFGVTTTRSGLFPRWAAILFTIGAVVFGLGMVPMIRSIGALLFTIGMVRLGLLLWKDRDV